MQRERQLRHDLAGKVTWLEVRCHVTVVVAVGLLAVVGDAADAAHRTGEEEAAAKASLVKVPEEQELIGQLDAGAEGVLEARSRSAPGQDTVEISLSVLEEDLGLLRLQTEDEPAAELRWVLFQKIRQVSELKKISLD